MAWGITLVLNPLNATAVAGARAIAEAAEKLGLKLARRELPTPEAIQAVPLDGLDSKTPVLVVPDGMFWNNRKDLIGKIERREARRFAAEISQALMLDAHQQNTELESEIDQLHEDIAPCRKISLVAKAVFVFGCATLLIGFLAATPATLVVAVGAVLGSLALLGSNSRTMDETVSVVKAQEARRSRHCPRL